MPAMQPSLWYCVIGEEREPADHTAIQPYLYCEPYETNSQPLTAGDCVKKEKVTVCS